MQLSTTEINALVGGAAKKLPKHGIILSGYSIRRTGGVVVATLLLVHSSLTPQHYHFIAKVIVSIILVANAARGGKKVFLARSVNT